ncbi:hypothetical protein CEXT_261591 [Caerostris extrusa]|uniref:Uncharacterized protein n=1 Tax=Caerostris extrusa TaxID=172846 RepID=A0AAV4MRW4_CAEEX|nr:hypothetical protein CEXT_261591 [Caerostris extrusa]
MTMYNTDFTMALYNTDVKMTLYNTYFSVLIECLLCSFRCHVQRSGPTATASAQPQFRTPVTLRNRLHVTPPSALNGHSLAAYQQGEHPSFYYYQPIPPLPLTQLRIYSRIIRVLVFE